MKAFKGIVQYKLMKEKETGEEWFIAALRLTPGSDGRRGPEVPDVPDQ